MKYRILLITSLSHAWDNGWYYRKGFEQNGHEVILFDPAAHAESVERVRTIVQELRPDFILHTKNELPAEIFEDLRRFTKVIQWHPDPLIQDWLPPYVKAADLFLTMSEGLLEDFRKINPMSYWLSQAFEPSCFETGEITPEDKKIFSSDITFVGNLGSLNQYLVRRQYLERVIDLGVQFKWWGPRIPRKFSTIPLLIGRIGRSYGGRFVWGPEFAKVVKLSKIFLAFDSMPQVRKSMSARMYTAVGNGAFYMCQHVVGIEDVLEPDKEIVTFASADEMAEKIRFYLPREAERQKIAAAGRARILAEHTYEKRTGQLISLAAGILQ